MNDRANIPNDGPDRAGQLVPTAQSVPALPDPYGRLPGYGGSVADQSEQFFTLQRLLEYWRIVYKRKWLILGIVAAFVVLGGLNNLMQTPVYTATVRLQIDPTSAKIVESGNSDSSDFDENFMQTQYQLLQTRSSPSVWRPSSSSETTLISSSQEATPSSEV